MMRGLNPFKSGFNLLIHDSAGGVCPMARD